MTNRADMYVVGAGPAGLATAIGSALRGMRVRVVDVERAGPIDKACGEGLLPEAMACLERLGIRIRGGQRFAGIRFLSGSRVAEGRFARGMGMGVRRTALHAAMLERAAELGVEVEWGTRLLGLEEVKAEFVVGADGGQSRVRSWAGIGEGWVKSRRVGLRQHFAIAPWSESVEVYWGNGVQAYVTPVGADEVGLAVLSERRLGSLAEGLEGFPELRARLAGAEVRSAARGALSVTRRLERVTATRVALVGDASGAVDAITGEGMALALRQAKALVEAMACGELAGYEGEHRRVMRRARVMSGALLQMDGSAAVRRGAMAVLEGVPGVFAGLLRAHAGIEEAPGRLPAGVTERKAEAFGG